MRLIDADVIKLPNDLPYKASVKRVLMMAPTVDAVEVVRCRECIFGVEDGYICRGAGFCMPGHATFPDYFCSSGERKDNVDNT